MSRKQICRNSDVQVGDLLEHLRTKFQSEGYRVNVKNYGDNGDITISKGIFAFQLLRADRVDNNLTVECPYYALFASFFTVPLFLLGACMMIFVSLDWVDFLNGSSATLSLGQIILKSIFAYSLGLFLVCFSIYGYIAFFKSFFLGNRLFNDTLAFCSK